MNTNFSSPRLDELFTEALFMVPDGAQTILERKVFLATDDPSLENGFGLPNLGDDGYGYITIREGGYIMYLHSASLLALEDDDIKLFILKLFACGALGSPEHVFDSLADHAEVSLGRFDLYQRATAYTNELIKEVLSLSLRWRLLHFLEDVSWLPAIANLDLNESLQTFIKAVSEYQDADGNNVPISTKYEVNSVLEVLGYTTVDDAFGLWDQYFGGADEASYKAEDNEEEDDGEDDNKSEE